MDSTTSAFSVLPIIGYALLAISLAYLGIRMYRYIRLKSQAMVSLPKPVSGVSQKSTFSWGRSTGWNWRRWTLPRVPSWSKAPETVVGKAKVLAHSKNLSVELLPTTGLPPPPTAMPTPISSASIRTPQLVDLTTPVTPPLATGGTASSYPASPRTPTPPFLPHISMSKPIYPTPPHASHPRPPSPHGLFATTSQKPHRRSRSLGGVPVRRLSGGTSGLRNAIELKELSKDHTRGTSREHLLIDFNSPSSSDEDRESITKISPAASDIGILPSGAGLLPLVDPRMVGRHVPLVDLVDDSQSSLDTRNKDDDGWKWFTPAASSDTLLSGKLGPKNLRPKPSIATSRVEKLVDVDSESDPEPVFGSSVVQVRPIGLDVRQHKEQPVDIHPRELEKNVKEATLVDLQGHNSQRNDYFPSRVQLVDTEDDGNTLEHSHMLSPPVQAPVIVQATFPHPLESLNRAEILPAAQKPLLQLPAVGIEAKKTVIAEQPSLLFEHPDEDHELRALQSEVSTPLIEFKYISIPSTNGSDDLESASPLIIPVEESKNQISSQGEWAWDVAVHSDPWASHIVDASSPDSDVFVYTGLDTVSKEEDDQDASFAVKLSPTPEYDSSQLVAPIVEHDTAALENSQNAFLFATESADEEGVPVLNLEDALEESNLQHPASKLGEHASLNEEDLTPKPTPAFSEVELPALFPDDHFTVHVPIVGLQEHTLSHTETPDDYPDPELLPLPDSPLLLTIDIPDPETPSLAFEKEESIERATPHQTPTPPASPPSLSPLRFANRLESLHTSPKGLLTGISHLRLPPSPRSGVVGNSPRASLPALSNDTAEDKENATPTALIVKSPNPFVNQKVEAILSTDQITSASESLCVRRKVLGDVSTDLPIVSTTAVEGQNVLKEVPLPPDFESLIVEEAVQHVVEVKLEAHESSESLPGSFPDSKPTVDASTSPSMVKADTAAMSTTIGARLAMTSNALSPRPSARAIVRSPFDIALAMQLRPGLGAGADPAWMVRFLMAMFGWLAVVVSGQAEF